MEKQVILDASKLVDLLEAISYVVPKLDLTVQKFRTE